jgi:predicted SnoaL-like aldol condensation-catalyzing enzyme
MPGLNAASATRAIVRIFATGDIGAIPAAVTDDYLDHQRLGATEIRGHAGFRRVVEAVQSAPRETVTIEDIVAAEDKAAVRLRWTSVEASGRASTRETLDLLRFVEGRLAEHWGAELSGRER